MAVRAAFLLWVVALVASGCVARRSYVWSDTVSDVREQMEEPLDADCLGQEGCSAQDLLPHDVADSDDGSITTLGDGDDHTSADTLDVKDNQDGDTDCTPNCQGRECGYDGCDSLCGSCAPEQACSLGGQCGEWPTCSGTVCPKIKGYQTFCNYREYCEYVSELPIGYKKWDIWVLVPKGPFTMGTDQEPEGLKDERPPHVVVFEEPFLIHKYEVTVEQYEACLSAEDGACTLAKAESYAAIGWGANSASKPGRMEHPQNALTRYQAEAVCQWLVPNGRLPSEAEWEYAASGPLHRKYPWGNTPEPKCSNDTAVFDEDGSSSRPWGCNPCTEYACSGTSPVTAKPSGGSWCGVMGMGGNVWEWCADMYHKTYDGAPTDGSVWSLGGNGTGVVRGGAFNDGAVLRRTSRRAEAEFGLTHANIGVRCARSVPPCVPECEGRQCGADGCGGQCGQCSTGGVCQDGQCVCQPKHHMDCHIGELFWFDSCGALGDLAQTCPCGCEDAACIVCK